MLYACWMDEQGVENNSVELGRRRLHYKGAIFPVSSMMVVIKEAEDEERQRMTNRY